MTFFKQHFQFSVAMVILLVVLFVGARFARADYDKRKELEGYAKAAKQDAIWARWQPRKKKSGTAVRSSTSHHAITAPNSHAIAPNSHAIAPNSHAITAPNSHAITAPNAHAILKTETSAN